MYVNKGYHRLHTSLSLSLSQSEQKLKKGDDLDGDDEKLDEEDSQFMKLAKKLTAKALQRKGGFDSRPHKTNPRPSKGNAQA